MLLWYCLCLFIPAAAKVKQIIKYTLHINSFFRICILINKLQIYWALTPFKSPCGIKNVIFHCNGSPAICTFMGTKHWKSIIIKMSSASQKMHRSISVKVCFTGFYFPLLSRRVSKISDHFLTQEGTVCLEGHAWL